MKWQFYYDKDNAKLKENHHLSLLMFIPGIMWTQSIPGPRKYPIRKGAFSFCDWNVYVVAPDFST